MRTVRNGKVTSGDIFRGQTAHFDASGRLFRQHPVEIDGAIDAVIRLDPMTPGQMALSHWFHHLNADLP